MSLKFETGTLTAPGATGNQTISLVDTAFETVKALLLWTSYQTAEGDTDGDLIWCQGIGTYRGGAVQQYAHGAFADDAVATADTASTTRSDAILRLLSAAGASPTVDASASLVSLGDAQFVINWTDLPGTASIKVHYVALGGSDITDALASSFDLTAATGNQDVTVAVGFGQPNLIFGIGIDNNTSTGEAAFWNPLFLSVGKSDTDQFISLFHDGDNLATIGLASLQVSGKMFVYANDGGSTFIDAALTARSSWPTDGFRVNKSVAAFAASAPYLALRGTFTSVIGSGSAPTTAPTVTQDLAVGATPRGAIFVHNSLVATATLDTASADLGTWGIGATDGTREGWAGIGDDDGAADAQTHRHHSESKAIKMYTPGAAGTLTSEADGSFSGNNVRLTWLAADTIAREYRYLILGDGPQRPKQVVVSPTVQVASAR